MHDGPAMIELAPHNPYGLALRSPVIVAPGCAAPLRDLDLALIGAVATRTAVLHTPPEGRRRWAAVPAGVVFERLPTIRFRTLLQAEAKRWLRSSVPVLLSLRGTPDDLAEMTARLEQVEGIAGIIVQSDDAAGIVPAVDAARSQTTLPLLTILPPQFDPATTAEIVAAGTDALIVGAYPPAAVVVDGAVIDGVLVGPTLVPWTIRALQQVASVVNVSLIALGGVADATIARHCIAAGATALMIDGALYGDPVAPHRIAAALTES